MDLLVVGHVTRDEVDGGVRLGGAASYAALAAACLGYETALVTVAPPDEPLLEPLRRAPRLHLHCVPSDVMTTFALEYAGGQRRLWLRRRARALMLDDIPAEWRRPRVAYVGIVAGECDTAFVKGMGAQFTGAGLQGWLRRTNDDGLVEPTRIAVAGSPVVTSIVCSARFSDEIGLKIKHEAHELPKSVEGYNQAEPSPGAHGLTEATSNFGTSAGTATCGVGACGAACRTSSRFNVTVSLEASAVGGRTGLTFGAAGATTERRA